MKKQHQKRKKEVEKLDEPPTFESPRSAYDKALWKWLKVVFWHYDDMKKKLEELESRLTALEASVKFINNQANLEIDKNGEEKNS